MAKPGNLLFSHPQQGETSTSSMNFPFHLRFHHTSSSVPLAYFIYVVSFEDAVNNNKRLMINYLYSFPSTIRMIKSRRMRWTGHVARMGDRRNAYRIFVGKPEGRRPLGRPRCRWVDNIVQCWGYLSHFVTSLRYLSLLNTNL
jgi:hypothetical protein